MLKILFISVLIGLVFLFLNCRKKMKTFKWDATSCAPKLFPGEMYQSYFVFENDYEMEIPGCSSVLNNGWGVIGPIVGGNNYKPVPVKLKITWMSYTENKFYTGSFTLPKDSITKMFEEGFTEFQSKKHGTYDFITVGTAPGGIVVVWLLGSGKTTEVGRYQASETKVSMHDFVPTTNLDQDAFVKVVLNDDPAFNDNLKKNGIPFGLWDTYREKFNWRPYIDFEDKENAIIDEMMLYYFNGEIDVLSEKKLAINSFESRPRIQKITCWWSNKRTLNKAVIILDEEEIFKAYRFIYQDAPSQEGQLRIHVNKDDSYIWIFLENTDLKNHRDIQLKKASIKIYPVDELDRRYFTVFKGEFKDE